MAVMLVTSLAAVGCKPKCNDASTDKAFVNLDDGTRSAIENAQKAQGARMCGEVVNGNSKTPAAMVFNGSMPTAWRAIEDELLKVGWVRTDQSETPKPDDTLFQVHYEKKEKSSIGKIPMLHVKFFMNKSCDFGDVCVGASETGWH